MIANAYKVCHVDKFNIKTSATTDRRYALEYGLNKKTTPKIEKVFVFETRHDAVMFAIMFKNTRVFSCYAENIVEAPKKIAADSFDFEVFWKKKSVENYSWSIPGSYVADSVTLLEEIK